jgi:hypothetical protein
MLSLKLITKKLLISLRSFETLDSYENLLSRFYNDQSSEDKEIRNIKNNISKIQELVNALAELKKDYEEKLKLVLKLSKLDKSRCPTSINFSVSK